MAYTPELSQKHSGALRRIAWALKIPMTKTIEHVFEMVVTVVNKKMICSACKDKSFCEHCVFNSK